MKIFIDNNILNVLYLLFCAMYFIDEYLDNFFDVDA